MRAWLIGGLALLVLVAAGAYLTLRDDKCAGEASMIYDGAVLPGGPQTADEALEGFLSVTDHDALGNDLPSDPHDYVRGEPATGQVTFTSDDLVISAGQRPNGWFIDSTTNVCDRD